MGNEVSSWHGTIIQAVQPLPSLTIVEDESSLPTPAQVESAVIVLPQVDKRRTVSFMGIELFTKDLTLPHSSLTSHSLPHSSIMLPQSSRTLLYSSLMLCLFRCAVHNLALSHLTQTMILCYLTKEPLQMSLTVLISQTLGFKHIAPPSERRDFPPYNLPCKKHSPWSIKAGIGYVQVQRFRKSSHPMLILTESFNSNIYPVCCITISDFVMNTDKTVLYELQQELNTYMLPSN